MADQSPPQPAQGKPPKAEAQAAPHRHRFLIGTLFALGTIIGIVAVLAVWTNRQALNTDNWTETSSSLLADKPVQTALSAYLVTELFKSVDVQAALQDKLPNQLQGLSGPLASGVQQIAGQVAPKLLASAQVQDTWAGANRAAHTELMKIVNDGGSAVSTKEGVVTLNLHQLVSDLAARIGIQDQVAAARSKLQGGTGAAVRGAAQQKLGITLPASTGQLEIMRSDQLKTAQDVAGSIKGLAVLLPLLTFGCFILAVFLAKGRRRLALRTTGWCFVGIGLVTLLARRIGGNQLVDNLVKVPSNEHAVHNIWNIATTLLYDIGAAMVVYGLIFVLAAMIAGPTRPGTALRRALAPSLRDRPVAVYSFAAIVYLVVIAWGPTPAFRQLAPILGIAALIVLGIESLRRITAREFPDAQPGDTMRALQARFAERQAPEAAAPAPAGSNGGHLADLERLAALHDRGVLTDTEFETEKATLIHAGV